jgi:hypothetical protein
MSNTFQGGRSGALAFQELLGSGPFGGSTDVFPSQRLQCQFTPGTALDQIDGVSYIKLGLAASTPQDVDLTALLDPNNNALTVARARYVAFKLLSTVDGAVVKVGNKGTNDFVGLSSLGSTINVYPSTATNDGWTEFAAPNATAMAVDATHKILKCDPGTTAATLLIVIGTSSA